MLRSASVYTPYTFPTIGGWRHARLLATAALGLGAPRQPPTISAWTVGVDVRVNDLPSALQTRARPVSRAPVRLQGPPSGSPSWPSSAPERKTALQPKRCLAGPRPCRLRVGNPSARVSHYTKLACMRDSSEAKKATYSLGVGVGSHLSAHLASLEHCHAVRVR